MSKQPRFEVVRSDAGWFARFVAANGAKVWQTEVYMRRRAAQDAISRLEWAVIVPGIDTTDVDERTAATS